MSFTIKKNSQSFKYLSFWRTNYKAFSETGSRLGSWGHDRRIATNFCSYYQDVFKLILFHFCFLLLIPSLLISILIITGIIYISPTPTIASSAWLIAASPSEIAILFACVGAWFWFKENIWSVIVDYIRQKLPEPKVSVEKPKKSPSVIKTWYEGFKHNFCHTINFEVESHDQIIDSE